MNKFCLNPSISRAISRRPGPSQGRRSAAIPMEYERGEVPLIGWPEGTQWALREGFSQDRSAQPSGGFQASTFREGSPVEVFPEGHQQPAGQSDDANPAGSAVAFGKAFLVPKTELTLGLVTQPFPGNLDRHGADAMVACFANALLSAALAALEGGRGQASQGADFPRVAETAPREELHHVEPGGFNPDSLQPQ